MPTPAVAAAPAASPAAPAAQTTPSAAPVKPNPVVPSKLPTHGQPAQNAAQTPKPEGTTPPPQKFKRKEKIDGQEVELEADEDQLWAAYRKDQTVNQRFESLAKSRKEVEAERARVQEMYSELADPTGEKLLAAYMKLNPTADPVDVLSSILQKRLHEEEQLNDPNIRERRRLENENRTFKEQAAKQAQEQEQARREAATQTELNRLGSLFGEALEQTKLPRNDLTVRMMAEAEATNRKQGWNLTPAALAKATEKLVHGHFESLLTDESVTDDQLLATFPTLTKRIHKAIVAKYKARTAGTGNASPDLTPRAARPSTEEAPKQRVVTSAEEHKAYGGKGLRTI